MILCFGLGLDLDPKASIETRPCDHSRTVENEHTSYPGIWTDDYTDHQSCVAIARRVGTRLTLSHSLAGGLGSRTVNWQAMEVPSQLSSQSGLDIRAVVDACLLDDPVMTRGHVRVSHAQYPLDPLAVKYPLNWCQRTPYPLDGH